MAAKTWWLTPPAWWTIITRSWKCFTKHKPHAGRQKGRKMPFLVPGDLYLDFQTRPSEAPNTSSVWIRCKSVQRFPRYFIHKQKVTNSAKNRTLRSSLRAVKTHLFGQLRTSSGTDAAFAWFWRRDMSVIPRVLFFVCNNKALYTKIAFDNIMFYALHCAIILLHVTSCKQRWQSVIEFIEWPLASMYVHYRIDG